MGQRPADIGFASAPEGLTLRPLNRTRPHQGTLPELETALDAFLRSLEGKNRARTTQIAYQTDLHQFFRWLHENNDTAQQPSDVERADVSEYLTSLGHAGVSGVTRARKLSSIREYFRYLEIEELIGRSPTTGIETPKKERRLRTFLLPDEYSRMLSLAGANPRDYGVLQVFLQTGVRVSELCALRLTDLDLVGQSVRVRGKGNVEREIQLEKKVIAAIRNHLLLRPDTHDEHLFLNRYGEPIGERGVRKLVVKYRTLAGITKKVSCHSLRHTFATYKAERGVSPFQLQQWMGHANLNTTQIYVHMGQQNAKKVMENTSL